MSKKIKIAYFPSTATREIVISKNGKSLDNYCTRAVTEEDISNGNYILDASFTLDVADILEEEIILKITMDYGKEYFRISKVTKGLRYIDIVARQITIADSLNIWIEDVRPESQNGQGALNWLMKNSNNNNQELILKSDITNISTAYYQDMNLYNALFNCEQSFMNRWGGEVLRRGYILSINSKIGSERGVSIREGKNLTGFSGSSNIDSLVTRARGKGYNGIKGNYIDSPLINNYSKIYYGIIEFQDVKVATEEDHEGFATEEEAIKELDNRIKAKYKNDNIDTIKATYNINFVELEKTEEYKKYVQAERVYIGDTIRCYVPKLKTDVKVRVVNKKYDVLAQRTEELTLSNEVVYGAITMNSIISELEKVKAETGNNDIASYINAMQQAGLSNSYVICRNNEFLAMDTKDINTARNVVKINRNGLFFSQNGYYGDYKCGFTIDGVVNADLIRTGILTAITIKSTNDNCTMNLDTGEVSFKSGRVGSDSTYIDLTNGKFVTKGTVLNVASEMSISKGQINNTGIINILNTAPGNAKSQFLMSHDNNGRSGIVLQADFINIIGDLIGANISTLENYMLQSEGII